MNKRKGKRKGEERAMPKEGAKKGAPPQRGDGLATLVLRYVPLFMVLTDIYGCSALITF